MTRPELRLVKKPKVDMKMEAQTKQFDKIRGFINEWAKYECYWFIICTGYATTWGIAQLNELIPSRCKTVVVLGDTNDAQFKCKDENYRQEHEQDKTNAIAFLERSNVDVFSESPNDGSDFSIAHGKAIIALNQAYLIEAALVGSVNLTYLGLNDNYEIMVECLPSEHSVLYEYIDITTKSDPITSCLLKKIREEPSA